MIRNLGPVIVLSVTRYTRCAQPGELADRTCFMTRLTINASVRAHQREPVLVPFYGLQGDIPTSDRMASFAFSTKLAAMYVCMAVGALHPHVRKNEVCMAQAARYARMHSTKGGTGLVVVEIRVGSDRAPVDRGVAILAGHTEVAVRVTGAPLDRLRDRALRAEPGEQK
jgi:hypothetical protein